LSKSMVETKFCVMLKQKMRSLKVCIIHIFPNFLHVSQFDSLGHIFVVIFIQCYIKEIN